MKNGRLLLEELIAFCNGKSNPIRVFSAEKLRKAKTTMTSVNVLCGIVISIYTRVLWKAAYFQLKNTTQKKNDFLSGRRYAWHY